MPEANTTNVSIGRQNRAGRIARRILDETRERRHVTAGSGRELRRDQARQAAFQQVAIVVAVEPGPGRDLEEGFDRTLRQVVAAAGRSPAQSGLDGLGKVRRRIGDDRLVQNERPLHLIVCRAIREEYSFS